MQPKSRIPQASECAWNSTLSAHPYLWKGLEYMLCPHICRWDLSPKKRGVATYNSVSPGTSLYGNVASIDGVNDGGSYIDTNTLIHNMFHNPFTIVIWADIGSGIAGNDSLVGTRDVGDGGAQLWIRKESGNAFKLQTKNDAGGLTTRYISATVSSVAGLHCLILAVDSPNTGTPSDHTPFRWYWDGAKLGNGTLQTTASIVAINPVTTLWIGAHTNSSDGSDQENAPMGLINFSWYSKLLNSYEVGLISRNPYAVLKRREVE